MRYLLTKKNPSNVTTESLQEQNSLFSPVRQESAENVLSDQALLRRLSLYRIRKADHPGLQQQYM